MHMEKKELNWIEYCIFSWGKIPCDVFNSFSELYKESPSEAREEYEKYWYTKDTVNKMAFEYICITDPDFVKKQLMWN